MISLKLDRREFLLSASLLSAGALAAGQGNQDFSKVQIKVTRVSGSVYMLQGEGGNIAASVGDEGSPSWTTSSLPWPKRFAPP